jgi:hypothetical protein
MICSCRQFRRSDGLLRVCNGAGPACAGFFILSSTRQSSVRASNSAGRRDAARRVDRDEIEAASGRRRARALGRSIRKYAPSVGTQLNHNRASTCCPRPPKNPVWASLRLVGLPCRARISRCKCCSRLGLAGAIIAQCTAYPAMIKIGPRNQFETRLKQWIANLSLLRLRSC